MRIQTTQKADDEWEWLPSTHSVTEILDIVKSPNWNRIITKTEEGYSEWQSKTDRYHIRIYSLIPND